MQVASFFLICCLLSTFLFLVNSEDYCAKDLCPDGKKHVACGKIYKRFAARCPSNARIVNLKRFKKLIVNFHNSKRNLIASGNLGSYKPAKRMATMQWNNQLAYLASLNVRQCKMQHDKCRNTRTFPKSGQNIGLYSYTGNIGRKSLRGSIKNKMRAFFDEWKNANMKIINKYPKNYSGPQIGHFTVMVAERNNRVGCAVSRWFDGRLNNILMACNYGYTNVVGEPIYRSGSSGASCRKGRNSVYKNLCDPMEVYPK